MSKEHVAIIIAKAVSNVAEGLDNSTRLRMLEKWEAMRAAQQATDSIVSNQKWQSWIPLGTSVPSTVFSIIAVVTGNDGFASLAKIFPQLGEAGSSFCNAKITYYNHKAEISKHTRDEKRQMQENANTAIASVNQAAARMLEST
jgi:hypothetical protein